MCMEYGTKLPFQNHNINITKIHDVDIDHLLNNNKIGQYHE